MRRELRYMVTAALRAARSGGVVRRGALPKGRTLLRSEENFYPMVKN